MKRQSIRLIMGLVFLALPGLALSEEARYSSTFTAPICKSGVSPCIVPASLVNGRDTMSGGVEPHQPNTLATSPCADGASGQYHVNGQSLDSFVVTDISGPRFMPGHTLQIDATVYCWGDFGSNSNLYVHLSNSVSSPSWFIAPLWSDNCAGSGTVQTLMVWITLGPTEGNQAIRLAFHSNAPNYVPCDSGPYNDRDDLVLAIGVVDSDSDGLPDHWENEYGCMKSSLVDNLADYDSDSLTNEEEFYSDTNPCNADTDADSLPDGWEHTYSCMNPTVTDSLDDPDSDGLTNEQEYQYYTDPCNPDTDNDGLSDGDEVNLYGTNPAAWDTDGGGESDSSEMANGRNPLFISDDAEFAIYSPSLATPRCSKGFSPCVVPASLINGRDNMTDGAEPNQPNTLASSTCADGSSGDYHLWESLDSFTITDLTGYQFLPGDTLRLDATVYCRSTGSKDWLYVFRSDSSSSPLWNSVGEATCTSTGTQTLSVTFNLGPPTGDQVIRAAFSRQSSAVPCDTGSYNDRDDVVLYVAAVPDTDRDGMPDAWENTYGCMQAHTVDHLADYDSDGLDNLGEYNNSTDPCNQDSDSDGMPDGWEVKYGLNPLLNDSAGDAESDGLSNGQEYLLGTNPLAVESDGDGLSDFTEVNTYGTNPALFDTDGDGMDDGWEVNYLACVNPVVGDSLANPDGDGLTNLQEYLFEGDPCASSICGDGLDNDGDGFIDLADPGCSNASDPSEFGSNACDDGLDNDGDGFTDWLEDLDCLSVLDTSELFKPTLAGSYDTSLANGIDGSGTYIYVADYNWGLQIINVSNPAAPTLAGTYDTPGYALDVMVSGNYAYVADAAFGLQILDVSNPAVPILIGTYDTPGYAFGVAVSGDYGYVADDTSGLQILDVSDSAVPILTGTYDTPGEATGVYVSGNYAYLADYGSGLQIIDISNPVAPTRVGSYNTPGLAWNIYVTGNYAYVADDTAGLQIINVSNPAAPILTATYNTPGAAQGVYVSGNYAYVADGTSGLQIINVSNPAAPTLTATYVSPVLPADEAIEVYQSGNYAYVAYGGQGLLIVDVSGIVDLDGDSLPNDWEKTYPCLDPRGADSGADSDFDGLTNLQEYQNSTDPCDADTDNDGASDGVEVNATFTDPLDPDSDDDLMFDGWEINAASCGLDPLFFGDALLDSDLDTLENIHEYFNNNGDGNVSDPCDGEKPKRGLPGGGYFGDGDGDLIIGSTDLSKINLKLNGRSVDYLNVFPADPVIQDMDGDLIIGSTDKSILSLILNAKQTDFIAGTPTALALEPPLPPATMQVGETVRIKVKLTNDKGNPSAGFGVVFDVVSGSATLLGGEGGPVTPEYSSASRWDLTALDGIAQMVVRADAAGPIVIHTELPYDGDVHTRQVILSPDIQINVNP